MSVFKKHFFLLLAVLAANTFMFAGDIPPATKRISGHNNYPVHPGTASATDSVQLPPMPLGFPLNYTNSKVLNLLSFGVDANSPVIENSAMNVKIKVHLRNYNSSSVLISDTSLYMTIKFHPHDTTSEIGKTTLVRSGAYKMKFTIDSIYVNGTAKQTLPQNIFLEGSISAFQTVDFTNNVSTPIQISPIDTLNIDCDIDGIADELQVSWPVMPGAEEYQLEWTFVNDYSINTTTFRTPVNLIFDFKNNSTRISTTNTFYRLPILFEHGYVLFRVRAVGYNLNNPPQLLTGVWSASDNGTVSSLSSKYYVWNPHEANKNWQLTTTFAEEGKKKEVISYFDGSQRNRQSVTKINSDKNAIVGETIYDFEGRPAINVLPTPVTFPTCTNNPDASSVIKYYENYNMNSSKVEYSAKDFDAGNGCVVNAGPMVATEGSSKYYSSNNPDMNAQQAFVPDAEQYPFSQVEYTPDNTGRIRRQGGVGPQYQLSDATNNKHETKYYYGQPNQLQLDRMFGSEVGDALHYKKNLVIDANGQVSVTYIDQEGRTIATSLSSESPNNLVVIPSGTSSATSITVDLFNKDYNGNSSLNTVDIPTNSIQFNSQLLVSNSGTHTFHYDLTVDTLGDACLASNICFSCVYDLEIKVIDECGNNYALENGSSISKHVGRFFVGSDGKTINFSTQCISNSTYNISDDFVAANLPIGNYNVIKTLTLNSSAIDFYVQAYLDSTKNTCFKTLHDFQNDFVNAIDYSGCELDCDKCLKQLGSKDDFVAQGEGTAADYDREYEECKSQCPAPVDYCEVAYESMLGDMSPQGQYGETEDSQGAFNPGNFPLSVFNESNVLPANFTTAHGTWRLPIITLNGTQYTKYIEDDFSDAIVNVVADVANPGHYIPDVVNPSVNVLTDPATGQLYTYPQNLNDVQDFVDNFKPSWAKSLIVYHPEYNYYEDCISYKNKCAATDTYSSYAFDSLMTLTNTFADAVSKKFLTAITPSSPNNALYKFNNPGTVSIITPWDPFAANLNACYGPANFSNSLAAKITNYAPGFSMQEMAAMTVRCGNQVGVTPTGSQGCFAFGNDFYLSSVPNYVAKNDSIRDAEWRTLKSFYIAEKQKQQILRSDYNALYSSRTLNDCIGNSNFSPVSSGMFGGTFGFSPSTDIHQPCSFQNMAYYANKQQRFPDPSEVLTNDPNQTAYQLYLQTGQCPNAMNLQQLLGGLASQKDLDNPSLNLLAIPYYTPLYLSLAGTNPPAQTQSATWNLVSSTPNSLTFSITDLNLPNFQNCSTTISTADPAFTTWDNIQNIYGLQATSITAGSYDFTFQAYVTVTPSGGGLPIQQLMIFTGTTCINIKNCTFQTTCSGNQLSKDLSLLMSMLAASPSNDLVSMTPVSLQIPVYQNLLSNSIKNKLAVQSGSSLTWQTISTSPYTFEIFDAANITAKRIRLRFLSVNPPSTATISSILTNPLPSFINMVSGGGQQYFDVDAVDVNGALIGTIHGEAFLEEGTTETMITMGVCGYPESAQCTQKGHEVRKDLENVLNDVLSQPNFNPDNNINIFASSFFTPLMQSYFPQTATSSASGYSVSTITDSHNNVIGSHGNLLIKLDGCNINLSHSDDANPALDLHNAVSFSGLIHAIGSADGEGNLHDFMFFADFNVNGTIVTDTIFGTSCLPLLNCVECLTLPVDNSGSGMRISATNTIQSAARVSNDTLSPCEFLYAKYIKAIEGYNSRTVPPCDSLHPYDFDEFQTLNFCCAQSSYNAMLDIISQIQNYAFRDTTLEVALRCYRDLRSIIGRPCIQPDFDLETTDCSSTVSYLYNLYYDSQYYTDTHLPFASFEGANPPDTNVLNQLTTNCSTCLYNYYFYILPYLDANYDHNLSALRPFDLYCDAYKIASPTTPCELLYNQYIDVTENYNAHNDPACADLTPISFTLFDARSYCCNLNDYNVFLDYITKTPTAGTNSQNCASDISGTPEKNCTPGFDLQHADCLNSMTYLYSTYYASQYYANTHLPFTSTASANPPYGDAPIKLTDKNCNCLYNYYLYLLPYLDPLYDHNLPALQPIEKYCTPTDPCTAAYAQYVNAVSSYSAYITTHPTFPPFAPVYTQAQFTNKKYCVCIDAFLTNITAITSSTYDNSSPSIVLQLLDINTTCNPPPPPCVPDGIPPVVTTVTLPPSTPCQDMLLNAALANAQSAYEQYTDSIVNYIRSKYIAHCMKPLENFTDAYNDKEYHFTLYYYDQAGNLIKTVPPEGVRFLDVNSNPTSTGYATKQLINADRTFGTHNVYTNHFMATTYEYNSLNQLVTQYMPDHDPMDVFEINLPNGLDSRLQTTAIQMVNNNRGYLTGYIPVGMPLSGIVRNRGYLYQTYDGGVTWQKVYSLVAANLKKVFMVDNNIGYAVGTGGVVLKTEDSGNTWDMLYTYDNTGVVYDLNDLHFIDANNGLVVGKGGRILVTNDGGVTFVDHSLNSWTGVNSADISINGITYTPPAIQSGNGSLYYITASALLNGTNIGAIFRSANGTTWTKEDQIIAPTLNDVYYFNTDSAYAVGEDGALLYTINSGVNWTMIETGLSQNISKVFFKNRTEGIALVDSVANYKQIYLTTNAGHTWTLFSKPGKYYNDIYEYYHLPYGAVGVAYGCKLLAVGKKGLVQKIILMNNTPNGIVDINSPTGLSNTVDLTAAWAAQTSFGYVQLLVSGSNGVFYYGRDYSAANVNWTHQTVGSFSTDNVKQIKAYEKYSTANTDCRGVLVTNTGIINELKLTTTTYPPIITTSAVANIPTNGTSVFTDLAIDTTGTSSSVVYGINTLSGKLRSITLPFNSAIPVTNVYLAGTISPANVAGLGLNNGKFIAVGLNGLINTHVLPTPPTAWPDRSINVTPPALYDLTYEPSSFLLYAVGSDGTVMKRTSALLQNSAYNWQVLETNTAEKLNRINFFSNTINKATIIGDHGTLLDGALGQYSYTNTKQTLSTNNLNDIVKVAGTNSIYIAGDNGTVLYTPSYTFLPFVTTNQNTTANFYGLMVKPTTTSVLAFGDKNLIHQCAGINQVTIKSIYPDKLTDVHFMDPYHGVVIGVPFTVRKTSDATQNFSVIVPDNNNPNTTNNLSVPNNLYTPNNPGNARELIKVWAVDTNYALVISTSDQYLAVVRDGMIQQQDPNLLSVPVNVPFKGKQLRAINFNDNNPLVGYIGANQRKMRKIKLTPVGNSYTFTIDNSIIVTAPLPGGNAYISDLQVLDNGYVIAAGEKGMVKLWNGSSWLTPAFTDASGVAYTPVQVDNNFDFNTVYFHDNNLGYVAGTNGGFFKLKINYSGTLSITAKQRSLADNLNIDATTNNLPVINAMSFATPSDGIWGGNYGTYPNGSAYPYARLIHDELERYSTHFYYDKLGRMVLSQNTKQYNKVATTGRAYSYTLYDALGRIAEVGEKTENNGATTPKFSSIFGTYVSSYFAPKVIDDANLYAWITSTGARTEVTHTYYDQTIPALVPNINITQENLRKRVASVTFETNYDNNAATYDHATHYSYDIHGNVKELDNENQKLAKQYPDGTASTAFASQKHKVTDYDYDLISGKVNTVSYQAGKPDQWYHQYSYDADNRITHVETSTDNIMWQTDAKYFYYKHGPLARTEIGQNQVQGCDYVYTLQGWIKGVNSNSLATATDPGKDNDDFANNTSINKYFAKDAYGYTLGYNDADYTPIDATKWSSIAARFEASITGSQLANARNNLFNGNIGHMVTTIADPNQSNLPLVLGSAYQYDQLNRLALATSYTNIAANQWQSGTGLSNTYRNEFTFDANGNILNQKRRDQNGAQFDNLNYVYQHDNVFTGNTLRNRLYHVNDLAGATPAMTDDIEDQGNLSAIVPPFSGPDFGNKTNYSYTEIGELKKDVAENITNIDWTVYGKIKRVTRTIANVQKTLEFDYDASGNRVAKHIYTSNGVWQSSTYYSRDAQGNVMSVYKQKVLPLVSAVSYAQIEKDIYGSSRIGMQRTSTEMINAVVSSGGIVNEVPGDRAYELTNHLGNVLSVITDRKIPQVDVNNNVTAYTADLITSNDYSAFGAPLVGRTFNKQLCSTTTNTVTTIPVNDNFNGGTTLVYITSLGYTAYSAMTTLSIASGQLQVKKVAIPAAATTIGVTKNFVAVSGASYQLDFDLNLSTVANVVVTVTNLTTNLAVLAPVTISSSGHKTYNFIATTAGLYRIQFTSLTNQQKLFLLDNIALTQTVTTTNTVCVNYEDYRYGMNGQEHEDEVASGIYTAEYWEYDSRLGRRWNLDPKPFIGISDYACFADNPILNEDIKGDRLKAGTDKQSQDDVKSVVKDKYSKAVKFDAEGNVSIDFSVYKTDEKFKDKDGNFNQKKFDRFVKRGMRSEGVALLNNMITATRTEDGVKVDENYYYAADYDGIGRLRSDPSKLVRFGLGVTPGATLDVSKGQYPQVNLSVTPHSPDMQGELPPAGYHGYVVLAPGVAKNYPNSDKTQPLMVVPRSEVVKHELSEIYLRTHHKQYYEVAHPNAGGEGRIDFFDVK